MAGPHPRPTSPANLLKLLVSFALPIGLLFGVAGTWDWPSAWVYVAVLFLGVAAAMFVFAKIHPDLLEERTKHWREGKRWDRPLVAIVALGPIVVQLICGIDKRYGWSGDIGDAWQTAAGAVSVAGVALTAWSMAVNRFFSAVVRIQAERGHTVVSAGPYAWVRHPGYAGMTLVTLGGPVLLGTLWGLVPAVLVAATFVIRTALEDRALRDELDRYAEYAARVRYRLIPGLW